MYEKLDLFLAMDTWHTKHPYDLQRFYRGLHEIVSQPNFNADSMADYITQKVGIAAELHDHPYAGAINHYRAAAWAVREYLEVNQMCTGSLN